MVHFLVHRAVDVAGFDAEHERDTYKDNKHERVHQSDLVIIGASVAEEGSLVWVRWLAAIHGHIEHSVDDSWGLRGVILVVGHPLFDDHEVHESK